MIDIPLILASTSPRRRELLAQAGLTFEVVVPGANGGVNEDPLPQEPVQAYVERLARDKSRAGWHEAQRLGLPAWPVLGADTTVSIDGSILGKPSDASDATSMLRALSGRQHLVYTAICLTDGQSWWPATSISQVHFRTLDAGEIKAYVDSGEPFGKAGAYGIQGRAALMVQHLAGSYSGVMGLPLNELGEVLRAYATQRHPK